MTYQEQIELAVRFEKAFMAIQENFMERYYDDFRIGLIDDCWKYIRGDFDTPEEENQFADIHLCGSQEKHEYNVSHALRVITDLYKELFNEVVENIVSKLASATTEDFEKISENKSENLLKDLRGSKVVLPIVCNPFVALSEELLDWNSIAERMDKYRYDEADIIYAKAEQGKPLTDEERNEYKELMVPHIKHLLKDVGEIADSLDISFTDN